jgi:hypothetical protein
MPFLESIETDRLRLRRLRSETAEPVDHHRYAVTREQYRGASGPREPFSSNRAGP